MELQGAAYAATVLKDLTVGEIQPTCGLKYHTGERFRLTIGSIVILLNVLCLTLVTENDT